MFASGEIGAIFPEGISVLLGISLSFCRDQQLSSGSENAKCHHQLGCSFSHAEYLVRYCAEMPQD